MRERTKKIILVLLLFGLLGVTLYQVMSFSPASREGMGKRGRGKIRVGRLLTMDLPSLELSLLKENRGDYIPPKRNIFSFAPRENLVKGNVPVSKEANVPSSSDSSVNPAPIEFLGTMFSGGKWLAVVKYQNEVRLLNVGQEFGRFRVEVVGEDYLEILHLDDGYRERFFLKRK